jgi:hypothetical protein
MYKLLLLLLALSPAVLFLNACQAAARSAEPPLWHASTGPLMTRWARDVSPANAHAEYPRPQLVRKDWQNLNGVWDFALSKDDAIAPPAFDQHILVPFPVESALSGVMQHITPKDRMWYHRTFTVPANWKDRHVLLHFDACNWDTTVTLNGKPVGTHRGGYDAFTFDVTAALTKSGPQDLLVTIWNPVNDGTQPRGKQVLKPGGIMYTASSGIWQTVWLEPVAEAHIDTVLITPDIDHEAVDISVKTVGYDGPADGQAFQITVLDDGWEIAQSTSMNGDARLQIPKPKLWSPDSPHLYSLRIRVNGDEVRSYFGMRKIALGKDENGITRLMLNNKPCFMVGPLDQGFWPDGIYTAPTDEALRFDIEMTKKLGMNMARKHVKVEPDRWYYWCDKLGLLVWQDMPAGDTTDPHKDSRTTANASAQFDKELQAMIDGRRNHPSIVMWVVFNEGWGQHDTERLVAWVKQYDPSRLVDNASGWTDKKCGDVHDMHHYPNPSSYDPEPERAAVLGEFGGLGLAIPGHTWEQKNWGYKKEATREQLTKHYVALLEHAWQLKDSPGLSAVVYTQTTDVETECNGLMTYDREMVKGDVTQITAANLGKVAKIVAVVPTAQKEPATWRYTTAGRAEAWADPKFDDSKWQQGPAGFGTVGTPGAIVHTTWNTGDIWLRRTFTLSTADLTNLSLLVHHDDDAEIYLNGVLACSAIGYLDTYTEFEISSAARATLKPGQNILAVHCHQNSGGQFIDVGLTARIPPRP